MLQLIKTDIKRAGIKIDKITFLWLFIKFFISRTIRTTLLIRMIKSNNKIVSFLSARLLRKAHIEIGKTSTIGEGLFLPHPWCIIIAGGVTIGQNVNVGQYVTIGGNFKKTKQRKNGFIQKLPIIGDRVMINPGAVIGGPVTIGNDVIIGANAVITHDVPSNSIAFGQNQLANKKITISNKGGGFKILD